MSEENLNSVSDVFEQKRQENEKIVDEVSARFKTIFQDPEQCEVITELYKQIFAIGQESQEQSISMLYANSFIDAFQTHLVGEGKLISEEEYINNAKNSFEQSIQAVTDAYKDLAEKAEKSEQE